MKHARSRPIAAALLIAMLAVGCSTAPTPTQPLPEAVEPPASAARPALERPFPEESFSDLLIAEFALRRGHYELALDYYLQQAQRTRDAGVAARATRLARFLHADHEALTAAQLWVELEPDNLEAQYMAAALLARFQRPLEALPHMIKVQESGGSGNFAALAAATLEQPTAVQQEVHDALDKQLERYPEEAELLAGKALLLQNEGHLDEALKLARQVLKREPDNVHAIIIEARLLQQLGRLDEARQRLQKVVEQYPDSRRLRLQYARLLTTSNIPEARRQFEIMVQQSPHDPDLLLSLALLSQEVGATDDAEHYLQRLLQLGQRTSEAHFYLAQLAEHRGLIDEALAHYRAVGPGQEFFASIGRSTGLLLRRDGLAAARNHLDERRHAYPEHAVRLYLFEAELLMQQSQLDEALQLLTEALAQHPRQPNLLYSRSLIHEQRHNVAGMEDDLRTILADDPDNSVALNALGYTLANLTDRTDEAWALVHRALQLNPDEPAILDSMGWVEYRRGNLQQALHYLQQAYAAFKDEEVAAHLGEVLWQLGEHERARQVWTEALQLEPDGPTLRETIQRLTGHEP